MSLHARAALKCPEGAHPCPPRHPETTAPQELKGLIGRCGVFIGARTHATIAATSMRVPSLSLAYSIKAPGIMADVLDRDRCTVMVATLATKDELLDKAAALVRERRAWRAHLEKRIPEVKERALLNAHLALRHFGGLARVAPGTDVRAREQLPVRRGSADSPEATTVMRLRLHHVR